MCVDSQGKIVRTPEPAFASGVIDQNQIAQSFRGFDVPKGLRIWLSQALWEHRAWTAPWAAAAARPLRL
jgi:hypothetical protein